MAPGVQEMLRNHVLLSEWMSSRPQQKDKTMQAFWAHGGLSGSTAIIFLAKTQGWLEHSFLPCACVFWPHRSLHLHPCQGQNPWERLMGSHRRGSWICFLILYNLIRCSWCKQQGVIREPQRDRTPTILGPVPHIFNARNNAWALCNITSQWFLWYQKNGTNSSTRE
jgi:hypothetical protein